MNSPFTTSDKNVTAEKVMYIISLKETASADEIATEIMEIQGLATEGEVAETKIAVEHLLRQLRDEGKIWIVSDAGEEMRFALVADADH